MLANAFEALKKFDWGADLAELAPIEDAVVAAHGNAGAGQELESRLIAALKESISRDAQDYVCRKLATVGTAAAVPTLAGLLENNDSSHMARYALERITAPEAARALREALGRVNGNIKIGVISSLGARRDAAAVVPLGRVLHENDPAVARAAAIALGDIGNAQAVVVLEASLQARTDNKQPLIDALLTCAEALMGCDKTANAMSIYKSLSGGQHGRLTRLAAARGVLACAGKRDERAR